MKIIKTKVYFKGLYSWGKGWENMEIARRWDAFWDSDEANTIFWHSFKVDDFTKTRYLVATGGSIFLHPLDFEVVLRKLGKTSKYVDGKEIETFTDIEDLEDIVKRCCEFCGGSYEIDPIEIHEI